MLDELNAAGHVNDADDADEPDEVRKAPTAGGDDELLTELPPDTAHGAFAGYQSNKRVRWFVGGALFVGTIGALWGGSWYVDYLERQSRRGITPHYAAPTDAGPEDRVMHWDSGPARLGLSREPPGVNLIVLPDRELRLAEGYDSAQISLRVENGRTVKMKVLTGRITVEELD